MILGILGAKLLYPDLLKQLGIDKPFKNKKFFIRYGGPVESRRGFILHSDDLFCDNSVITSNIKRMLQNNAEICFSDIVIVNRNNEKIMRYYKSSFYNKWLFRIGWMPPHPTCFINKTLFDRYGYYSLDYKIASDFDLLLRFLFVHEVS